MILLLAQSNHEAEAFAMNNGMREGSWHYIISVCSLRGLVRPLVCRVGEYWMRSDILSIESALHKRQAVYMSTVDKEKNTE